MMRLLAGLLLTLALAAPASASAQDSGTYTSDPLEWGSAIAWIDANADAKADYCRLLAGARVACTLSTGAGFGATITSPVIDAGYPDARAWGDVDGDHRADYCRRVGGGPSGNRISCTRSTGDGFVTDPATAPLDWGFAADTAFADATGDGRADYCRLTGAEQTPNISCAASTGQGFGATFSAGPLDAGGATGRAWVDFDGDGKVDFCRVLSGAAACSLSTGTGFSSTITSFGLDSGYGEGRTWADVDGDRRADYCRRVGNPPTDPFMQCTLSTGTGFGTTFTSGRIDWGADTGYAWVDFDGDGDRDFCRATSTAANQLLFCTLWTPTGFGDTKVSAPIDWGYGTDRAWVDHNGDGLADYCRRVGGGAGNERISCTLSDGTGFGALASPAPAPTEPAPAAAPPAPAPAATPVPPRRIVVTLSFFLDKGRFTRFSVKGAPRGATITAKCRKGCARKSYTKRNARGAVSLLRLVRGKRVKVGTAITVTVTRPGEIGAVKTLTLRRGRREPQITTRCLAPGAKKAAVCRQPAASALRSPVTPQNVKTTSSTSATP